MSGINTAGDIPKAWRDLFALIKDHVGGAVMAGGCLRDRDNGVKVNDIDIFVPMTTGKIEDIENLVKLLLELGATRAEMISDKLYPTGVDNKIVGVVEAKFVSCPLVIQLIVGDWGVSIPDLFHCFDYGICMIAYDGKNVHRAGEYFADQKLKVFRLCTRRSRGAFQKSIDRYARLSTKYPGWTFDLGHFHAQYGGYTGGIVSGDFDYNGKGDAIWRGRQAMGRLLRPSTDTVLTHYDIMGKPHFMSMPRRG